MMSFFLRSNFLPSSFRASYERFLKKIVESGKYEIQVHIKSSNQSCKHLLRDQLIFYNWKKINKVWLPNKLLIISHAKWLTVKILVLACKLKLM